MNKDQDVFHVGANPQYVDPNETPEQAAAREEYEANIHAPEIGKAAPVIVFDDKGNPMPVHEDDESLAKDRAKDAAEERAERRKDGGDKR
jgi:hypothetical protein